MKITALIKEAREEKWTGGIYTLDANSAEALVDLVKAVRVLMCYPNLRRYIGTDCHDSVATALAAVPEEWK